jgi:hypothetical protein
MVHALAIGIVLAQVAAASVPPAVLDSATTARLRARLAGQAEIRVTIERDMVELTEPVFLDSAIAYRRAWSTRREGRDTSLANPLPVAQVSSIQVRGKLIWQPMLGGGLSLGVSVLATTLLNNLLTEGNDADGATVARLTLMGLGIGAALGAVQGTLSERWITVYRRRDMAGGESELRRGGDSNPR